MKLYNTLTRKIEEITSTDDNNIKIYSCGPTVYDYQHIGNWFTYIRYDLLIRNLLANGFTPEWVINITDVGHLVSDADSGEDKLIVGAARENKTAWQVAEYYAGDFLAGLQKLNITRPSHIPKASDHINEQIELIKTLEAKGFTYVIDDGVYYDTSKFPDYAKLAQLNLDEQEAGKRVNFNPQKRNSSDFALWKFSPTNQKRDMQWDSPWGVGFPGWHIECSAMILKYLGPTIDIHSGGIDHIPVHHTNEIAQSEAATGQKLANLWMHTNHILLDEQKISKSLGNGITLSGITDKGYELEAVRLLALESHYRTQSKFGWSELEAANARLKDYRSMAVLRWQATPGGSDDTSIFEEFASNLTRSLNDDLSTPKVLAAISLLADKVRVSGVNIAQVEQFHKTLQLIDRTLGLTLSDQPDITTQQKHLITEREKARASKDWGRADQLRDELQVQGIELNDTDLQTQWARK